MRFHYPSSTPTSGPFYAAIRMWGTGTILSYERYHSADDRALSLAQGLGRIHADPLNDWAFGHPIQAGEVPGGLEWSDSTHLVGTVEVASESAYVD